MNAHTRCDRCDGCGLIADSDDGVPSPGYTPLPFESQLAKRLGIVAPIPCPVCCGDET